LPNPAAKEAELFERYADRDANLGLAMIHDGNGAKAFETLLRYRGTALAELWRALRLLKALQAEPAQQQVAGRVVPPAPQTRAGPARELPSEPEARTNPGKIATAPPTYQPKVDIPDGPRAESVVPDPAAQFEPRDHRSASCGNPNEPEARRDSREIALRRRADRQVEHAHASDAVPKPARGDVNNDPLNLSL
jgi:hypothetical protein